MTRMGMAACAALMVVLTWSPAVTVRASAPAEQAAAVDLDRLEAALAAAPDDLKTGNDYRMAVIRAKAYDRAIAFFEKLVAAHPTASNAHLNFGFAYVDKIPDAGAITQVILANNALGAFTKSIEVKPSWIGLYTRGNSYLFWPRIFNRTHLGLADLNAALKMQKADSKRTYHVRVYVALGDGYWKSDDLVAAANTWREGLSLFPNHEPLKQRLAKQGDELKALIEAGYDPAKRVDTSLQEIWVNQ
jgi:tetratricopeptide (TPR) repeat protein